MSTELKEDGNYGPGVVDDSSLASIELQNESGDKDYVFYDRSNASAWIQIDTDFYMHCP